MIGNTGCKYVHSTQRETKQNKTQQAIPLEDFQPRRIMLSGKGRCWDKICIHIFVIAIHAMCRFLREAHLKTTNTNCFY